MNNPESELKYIRNTFIRGLLCFCIPALIFNIIGEERLDTTDVSSSIYAISLLFSAVVFISVFYGYFSCWGISCKYAEYKGYPWLLGFVAGFFSFFGISFLFLLDSKREAEIEPLANEDNDFATFNLWSILLAYVSIVLLLYPIMLVGLAVGSNIGIAEAERFLDDENISNIIYILMDVVLFWYFYKKFVVSKLNFSWLLGFRKKINIWLPLSLAVAEYFFNWGFNGFTLYGMSFVVPSYVEGWINREQVSTGVGFTGFFISAVIFAPIWEEIICRGILFQKIAVSKNVFWGIIYSSLFFAVIHFRYDLIPLFIGGVILSLLYLRTKQLLAPILLHFFYNLIVTSRLISHHYFNTDSDFSGFMTASRYQEHFVEHLNSSILFMAFTVPYLIYFIYKNFPRHNDINKLPYYVNCSHEVSLCDRKV